MLAVQNEERPKNGMYIIFNFIYVLIFLPKLKHCENHFCKHLILHVNTYRVMYVIAS